MCRYNMLENKILDICRKEYEYFLNKANVHGLGLGYKVKGGFETQEKCIKVFVVKKLNYKLICGKDLIPRCYKGIKTDVVESSISTSYSLTNRIRPVPGGYDIGPENRINSGTMGCLVTDDIYYYILSSNHILTGNQEVKIGEAITQPSFLYQGKPKEDVVAHLFKYIPIRYMSYIRKPDNYVDCAIARVTNKSLVSKNIAILGYIKGSAMPILGEEVQKVGGITEVTTGKIMAIGVTQIIYFSKGECLFKNQINTTPMAANGDSGSILLNSKMKAIGLLMAGGNTDTNYNPILDVLRKLDVKILTGR